MNQEIPLPLTEVHFNNTTTPGPLEIKPTDRFIAWQNTAAVVIRSAWLHYFKLCFSGTMHPSNLRNFKLYIDEVCASQVISIDDKNHIVFHLEDKPVEMKNGLRSIRVMADITRGEGHFTFSLAKPEDFCILDDDNVHIIPKVGDNDFIPLTTGIVQVN
ncbi:MAG: hypothetical protein AAB877_01475 [Patescibacteria group bacterium]